MRQTGQFKVGPRVWNRREQWLADFGLHGAAAKDFFKLLAGRAGQFLSDGQARNDLAEAFHMGGWQFNLFENGVRTFSARTDKLRED